MHLGLFYLLMLVVVCMPCVSVNFLKCPCPELSLVRSSLPNLPLPFASSFARNVICFHSIVWFWKFEQEFFRLRQASKCRKPERKQISCCWSIAYQRQHSFRDRIGNAIFTKMFAMNFRRCLFYTLFCAAVAILQGCISWWSSDETPVPERSSVESTYKVDSKIEPFC